MLKRNSLLLCAALIGANGLWADSPCQELIEQCHQQLSQEAIDVNRLTMLRAKLRDEACESNEHFDRVMAQVHYVAETRELADRLQRVTPEQVANQVSNVVAAIEVATNEIREHEKLSDDLKAPLMSRLDELLNQTNAMKSDIPLVEESPSYSLYVVAATAATAIAGLGALVWKRQAELFQARGELNTAQTALAATQSFLTEARTLLSRFTTFVRGRRIGGKEVTALLKDADAFLKRGR